MWRLIFPAHPADAAVGPNFPSNRSIALFALLLGLAGFAVRIVFIANEYNFKPLNLQLPFLAQYVALFVLGLIAFRRNWLSALSNATGRFLLGIALLLILVRIPILQVVDASGDPNALRGGWTWQSMAYALW